MTRLGGRRAVVEMALSPPVFLRLNDFLAAFGGGLWFGIFRFLDGGEIVFLLILFVDAVIDLVVASCLGVSWSVVSDMLFHCLYLS